MSPSERLSVAQITAKLRIDVITLYDWKMAWLFQVEVVSTSLTDTGGWGATDKFTVVRESAGLNATELSTDCRERDLYPEQVKRWQRLSGSIRPNQTMAAMPPDWWRDA